jgi:hypothetical protein
MSSASKESAGARLISLADEDRVKEILAATVLDLWKVVNTLTRLRPSRRDRYRVAIFGSARAQPGTFVYEEVKRVSAAFATMGCDIVTGGGPGLMQAANEGATSAGATGSVGIRVELPFEQEVNPFVDQAFEHETFSSSGQRPPCWIRGWPSPTRRIWTFRSAWRPPTRPSPLCARCTRRGKRNDAERGRMPGTEGTP